MHACFECYICAGGGWVVGGGGMSVEEARVGERGRECESETKTILYIFYIYIFLV